MPSLSHPLLTTGQLGAVLQAAQILSWLLRAPDGHAKYFSIRLLPRGRFPLTRLYDVMSAYPVLGDSRNQWSPFEIKPAMSSARTARKHLRDGGLCALELRGVVHRRGDVGECLVGEQVHGQSGFVGVGGELALGLGLMYQFAQACAGAIAVLPDGVP